MFEFLLAILPIMLLLFLTLVLRWKLVQAALLSLFLLVPIVFFGWHMPVNWIVGAGIKGGLFALEIVIIILGALFFLSILNKRDMKEKFKFVFHGISQDRRVQVVIVGFVFATIIEASAGFGTPAMLAAPILLFLGFPALAAVTLVLIGAPIATIFGALGLPVVLGFRDVLNLHNIGLIEITNVISLLNVVMVFLVLVSVVAALIYLFGKGKSRKIKYLLEIIPFLVFVSLAVTLPGIVIGRLIGPELVFLVGGIIGLILTIVVVQRKWLIPKSEWDFDQIKIRQKKQASQNKAILPLLLKTITPYFFLILILFLSRADFLPVEAWLRDVITINWRGILHTNINYSFSPLYSIGVLLVSAGLIMGLIYKLKFTDISHIFKNNLAKIKPPLLVLIVILVFVKIFIYSGYDQVDSLIVVLTQGLFHVLGPIWPIFAPLIGTIGAFIVGSTTVSNILLGNIQANFAVEMGLSVTAMLAAQGIGAALGNMASFHNIIAASSVVELKQKQLNHIILYNLPLAIILSLILGVIIFVLF